MKLLPVRVFLAFTLLAMVVSSCVTRVDIVAFCNRVQANYTDDGGGQSGYITIRTEDGHRAAHQFYDIAAISSENTGTVTISLDDTYPDGTKFKVYNSDDSSVDGSQVGEDTCGTSGHQVQWFNPGDNRLNRQAYAYAAIYCDDTNQRVGIYGIHSASTDGGEAGVGFPAIFVPYTVLPPTPTQGNTLIQQYADVGFYRLTTGEYQVNAGPDNEGKTYVVIFDGCPNTYMRAYMMQNGVMTPSEVYPR